MTSDFSFWDDQIARTRVPLLGRYSSFGHRHRAVLTQCYIPGVDRCRTGRKRYAAIFTFFGVVGLVPARTLLVLSAPHTQTQETGVANARTHKIQVNDSNISCKTL